LGAYAVAAEPTVGQLEDAIVDALRHPETRVVGIVGRWGVGKTHIVREVLRKRASGLSPLKQYAYVSLFGAKSVAEIKSQILGAISFLGGIAPPGQRVGAGRQALDAIRNKNAASAFAIKERLQSLAKSWPLVGNATSEAIRLLADLVEFSAIRDMIVCLDDLERVSNLLSMAEVMGLASLLANERSCKVVLIFSRDNLNDENKKWLSEYREKVFDREIVVDPPISHTVKIAAGRRTGPALVRLQRAAETLQIKNIRVLRRLAIAMDEVIARVPDLVEPLKDNVSQSLATLLYCHLMPGDGIPSIAEVLAIEYVSPVEDKEDAEKKGQRSDHLAFLRNAGWVEVAEWDRHLADYVRDGYCDWQGLAAALAKDNDVASASIRKAELDVLWSEYRTSFKSDAEWRDFGQRLKDAVAERLDVIDTNSFDSALWILRQTDLDPDADALLARWTAMHEKDPAYFDLDHLETFGRLKDDKLRQICVDHQGKPRSPKAIREVLTRMGRDRSWGGDDSAALELATVSDYTTLFREGDLSAAIMAAIRLWLKLGNPDAQALTIKKNIEDALRIIGTESRLNRERVLALGVKLEQGAVETPRAIRGQ
jgi:hypothetical protein